MRLGGKRILETSKAFETRRREGREGKDRMEDFNIEDIASIIVDAAIKVHMVLGPGLLESAYQKCMEYELKKQGLSVESEVTLPVIYGNIKIDAGYSDRYDCGRFGHC